MHLFSVLRQNLVIPLEVWAFARLLPAETVDLSVTDILTRCLFISPCASDKDLIYASIMRVHSSP